MLCIDDTLLDCLGDRWPLFADYRGQSFVAWLTCHMHYYNEYGYPIRDGGQWESLWDIVVEYPLRDDVVEQKIDDLRARSGTFVSRVKDLKPFATYLLMEGKL